MKLKALLFSIFALLSLTSFASSFPTAVDDAPQEFPAEVFVYPNPSNGLFFVELQSAEFMQVELKVVSIIGKTVTQQSIESNNRVQIDLTDLPKGVYFVQLMAGKDTYLKRVVIQ